MAKGCLEALASGHDLEFAPGSIEAMLARLRMYIPQHVQMYFHHVHESALLLEIKHIEPALVAEVYRESMLGIRGHIELSHMEERLGQVLEPELRLLAFDLLTETAVTGRLTADAAVKLAREHAGENWRAGLDTVRGILEHDGYLGKRGDDYRFLSGLIEDWWRARFGFAYVPVEKRGL